MRNKGSKWKPSRAAGIAVIAVLLGVIFLVAYDPAVEEADAVLPRSLPFSFASEQRHRVGNVVDIETGPGHTGQAIVNGTIEFYRSTKLLRTRVFIFLHFRSENPEVIGSVFPQIIEIEPMAKLAHYPINVNILVAPMTRYSTGVNPLANITVWGEWQAKYQDVGIGPFASGVIPDYPLYVNVRPFHYLQMSFDPVMLELSPGYSGWVTCTVLNTGNGYERVELGMPGQLVFAKSGWVFEFEETYLNIDPGSEASTRIKVTAPRKFQLKFHMEMHDFPVHAVSYYSEYQVKDGHLLEPIEYEMGFMVYIFGVDFVFIPLAWATVIFLAIALVLFNFGINVFVMKKRKLPRGKDPGFIALYHLATNPERRAKAKVNLEEKKRLRKIEKERRLAEKAAIKASTPKKETAGPETPSPGGDGPSTEITRAPVLDLKRRDDDFDIELPSDEPVINREKPRRPLLGGARKRDQVEKDMIDVLSSLDD